MIGGFRNLMRGHKLAWLLVGICLLLCLGALLLSRNSLRTYRLTREHSAELQEAYERYAEAIVIAYKTADTSQLHETTTGYELKHHLEIVGTAEAEKSLEGWKVEVVRVTVREYSETAAEALVEYRVVGDIPQSSYSSVWIVHYERADRVWKVSSIEPYFTSDRG